MKILFLLAMPYLPLTAFSIPDASPLGLQPEKNLTGAGLTFRGPVGNALPDGPSALFSKEAVRERSREWEIKRLESCAWRLLMSARCAVRGDLLVDDLRAMGAHADAFIETLDQALGGESKDLRFSVRVFRDRHEFDVYASVMGAAGADSFYDIRNTEAVLYWPANGQPWRLLMHELTHEYLDRTLGRRDPVWLSEGTAEYFANYEVRHGACTPGGGNPETLKGLARAGEEGSLVPLGRLLVADRREFYGENHELLYAEAWSLVKFLADHQDAGHPLALWELVRGKGIDHIWDLKELERGWLEAIGKSVK